MLNPLLSPILIASIAGVLLGFIQHGNHFLTKIHRTEQIWTDINYALIISIFYGGAALGALVGRHPTDRLGGPRTLLVSGLAYCVSSIVIILNEDLNAFLIARFAGGFALGLCTVAAPLYIAELCPRGLRGRLTAVFPAGIAAGYLVFLPIRMRYTGSVTSPWSFFVGIESAIAFTLAFLSLYLPDSPRWLIRVQRDKLAAREAWCRLMPDASKDEIDKRLVAIEQTVDSATKKRFWTWKQAGPIQLVIGLALFSQFAGFAPQVAFAGYSSILEETNSGMLSTFSIVGTYLGFSLLAMNMIDGVGRKPLLALGAWGSIIFLGLGYCFFSMETYELLWVCTYGFLASYSIGIATVFWVYIAEIFPLDLRARGQALGCFIYWLTGFLLSMFLAYTGENIDMGWAFQVYAVLFAIQLIWILVFVKESMGRSLDDI